jgi:hypothetical protein
VPEVVNAVEQQPHLAEVILGEVLEAGVRPAKHASDAQGRRRVVLAERIDGERLLEILVRKKDPDVAAGGNSAGFDIGLCGR